MTAVITTSFEDENGYQCVRLEGSVTDLFVEMQSYKEADPKWRLHADPRKTVAPRGLSSITLVRMRPPVTPIEFPEQGPYTEEMMQKMPMELLQERARAEYGLKERSKAKLIQKILKHYEGDEDE